MLMGELLSAKCNQNATKSTLVSEFDVLDDRILGDENAYSACWMLRDETKKAMRKSRV